MLEPAVVPLRGEIKEPEILQNVIYLLNTRKSLRGEIREPEILQAQQIQITTTASATEEKRRKTSN